ncbi:MAG: tRNA pseudouridine(13) synthase TruD [Pseudomonadota bacterium]
MNSLPDWARAHGEPLFAARIRSTPEDFAVTEVLGYDFSDDGEHDYLFICKRGANTEWVARQLARFAGVAAKEVGYSGLKDRHAVTRQWFSVPRWNAPDWDALEIEGVVIETRERHRKKLRRGVHRENQFRIVLRGEGYAGRADDVSTRLQLIRTAGVPNYFGEQRFGRDGGNLALANEWASGARLPRHKRSLAISTVRSFLFNDILQQRVVDGTWNQVLDGDTVNLDGTGSVFDVDGVDDDIRQRSADLDLHPTAPLAGDGSTGQAAYVRWPDWMSALAKARVEPAARATRLRVRDLEAHLEDDALTLSFALGKGAYATSVLREIAATG